VIADLSREPNPFVEVASFPLVRRKAALAPRKPVRPQAPPNSGKNHFDFS
jgi:hypothetical protein